MNTISKLSNLANIGWKTRHVIVIIAATVGTYLFLESRAQWSEMHRWNRAVGDMSLVMIAFSMAIGPLSRLVLRLRALIPWRRELGIYGVLLAIVHTIPGGLNGIWCEFLVISFILPAVM